MLQLPIYCAYIQQQRSITTPSIDPRSKADEGQMFPSPDWTQHSAVWCWCQANCIVLWWNEIPRTIYPDGCWTIVDIIDHGDTNASDAFSHLLESVWTHFMIKFKLQINCYSNARNIISETFKYKEHFTLYKLFSLWIEYYILYKRSRYNKISFLKLYFD